MIGIMCFHDMPQQVSFKISEVGFPTNYFVIDLKKKKRIGDQQSLLPVPFLHIAQFTCAILCWLLCFSSSCYFCLCKHIQKHSFFYLKKLKMEFGKSREAHSVTLSTQGIWLKWSETALPFDLSWKKLSVGKCKQVISHCAHR